MAVTGRECRDVQRIARIVPHQRTIGWGMVAQNSSVRRSAGAPITIYGS